MALRTPVSIALVGAGRIGTHHAAAIAYDVHTAELAVRSGRDKHEFDVYVWDDHGDMWIIAPDDEEDGAT